MKNIGQRIKSLRKNNGLTQERLANALGVTYKAVSKWECGQTVPDLAMIIPLTRILKVSADELLGGKKEEIDHCRAKFDERCERYFAYDMNENYLLAQQAVSEYPLDYKYLTWLAETECFVAYMDEYKDDPSSPYSAKLMEKAILHNQTVIDECQDDVIRDRAIYNMVVCYHSLNQPDEAIKYASMLPEHSRVCTRDMAMDLCLQDGELIKHQQWRVYRRLNDLCLALSRIYSDAAQNTSVTSAALDAEEAILRAMFSSENFYGFHTNMCCAYQQRAVFEVKEGNYEKAMEHLRTMMDHARKVTSDNVCFSNGVFEGTNISYAIDNQLPYIYTGVDDINQSIPDQLKNRMKRMEDFAPLRDRADFQELLKV